MNQGFINHTYTVLMCFALIFLSCNIGIDDDGSESTPELYPAPKTVDFNSDEGYAVNPVTGDSVVVKLTRSGDTLITGKWISIKGLQVDPSTVLQPKSIKAGKPFIFPANSNIHNLDKAPQVIEVNQEELKIISGDWLRQSLRG